MINNGCTQIYGSNIDLTGKSISFTSDGIYVNGKPIEVFDESEIPVLKIEITGNVESLTTEEGEITVNGHVGTVVSKDGDIKCRTGAMWRTRTETSIAEKSWETVTQRTATFTATNRCE